MKRVAVFSDLHIATSLEHRAYGQHPAENLRQAIAQMQEFSPQHLIVAGDCAHKMGLKENYTTLAGCLDPVREANIEIHFLVGNHDSRENLRAFLGEPKSFVEGRHTTKLEFPEVTWLLLDTQLGLHEVRGCIGVRQLAWIKQELAAAPNQPFIIVGHHHPEAPNRQDSFPEIGLRDTKSWLVFLDRHPQIRAYMFGHTHSWRKEQTPGGTWLINLPPTGFVFQEDRPCGWVAGSMGEAGLKLELRTLNRDHPENGDRAEVIW